MRRRSRLVLLAAALGLIVPTAVDSSAASAVDQDLVVSAVAGPAGTEVTATSASCDTGEGGDALRFLSLRLIAGTAPNEMLAGAGTAFDDEVATIVVPDWIDPSEPAVLEAACVELDFSAEEPTEVPFAYDPVAFDVEVPIDPPVQERTYSRTSLLAGQAFAVDGSGCFLPGGAYAGVDVGEGDDLSFRTQTNFISGGGADLEGDAFFAPVPLTNSGVGIGFSQTGDDTPVVESIEEFPTDIPAGTYTTISYCVNEAGTYLMYEPELVEVTGNAPFGDIDLTVPANSRTATAAGGSCTSGEVSLQMEGIDITDVFSAEPVDGTLATGSDAVRTRSPIATRSALRSPNEDVAISHANGAWAEARGAGASTRALADDGYFEAVVSPDADGAWSASDDVSFDDGFVEAYAWCGDPLAEGFIYDPQGAAVRVVPAVPETTTTTTAPTPVPANAVQGTPTYAG